MPRHTNLANGAPCWIELFTSDPDRTVAFYESLFGWTHEQAGEEYGHYITFQRNGEPIAGGMRNDGTSGAPDFWTTYLSSGDAEATVAAVAAAGGQVHMPAMEIPEMGTMAMVADPGGAAVGIWQAASHTGFATREELGAPRWFELHTRDYDRCLDFYRSAFGFEIETASDSPEFRYSVLREGDRQAAGIMDAAQSLPEGVPSSWSIYFDVTDVDAACATVVELGGTVVQPPEDTPYGRLAGVTDPAGTFFKLMSTSNVG